MAKDLTAIKDLDAAKAIASQLASIETQLNEYASSMNSIKESFRAYDKTLGLNEQIIALIDNILQPIAQLVPCIETVAANAKNMVNAHEQYGQVDANITFDAAKLN